MWLAISVIRAARSVVAKILIVKREKQTGAAPLMPELNQSNKAA